MEGGQRGMEEIRLDYIVYFILVLLLCSMLGFTCELNGLQKFRVEVDQERLAREQELLNLTKISVDLGIEVKRLRGGK